MLPLAARAYGCIGTVRPDERETSPISVRFREQPGDRDPLHECQRQVHPSRNTCRRINRPISQINPIRLNYDGRILPRKLSDCLAIREWALLNLTANSTVSLDTFDFSDFFDFQADVSPRINDLPSPGFGLWVALSLSKG